MFTGVEFSSSLDNCWTILKVSSGLKQRSSSSSYEQIKQNKVKSRLKDWNWRTRPGRGLTVTCKIALRGWSSWLQFLAHGYYHVYMYQHLRFYADSPRFWTFLKCNYVQAALQLNRWPDWFNTTSCNDKACQKSLAYNILHVTIFCRTHVAQILVLKINFTPGRTTTAVHFLAMT